MKFNLKDLMWSVTFACLGIGAITSIFNYKWAYPGIGILLIPIALSAGALIGAAIGALFQKVIPGACLGFALTVLCGVLWFVSYIVYIAATWA